MNPLLCLAIALLFGLTADNEKRDGKHGSELVSRILGVAFVILALLELAVEIFT